MTDIRKGDDVWVRGVVRTVFKNGVVRVGFVNEDPCSPYGNGYYKGEFLKFAAVSPDKVRLVSHD